MKHTFQCVKCHSTAVIKIEGSRFNQNHLISLVRYGTTSAVLDRYVCTHCGYTEEWIQMDKKFLRWVEKNRVSGDLKSDFV